MHALYIGIQTPGTTSQLRWKALKRVLPQARWTDIDTDSVFLNQSRWARTLAFRLRTGPAVSAINHLIRERLPKESDSQQDYDLIWIDKAVYLWPDTVKALRSRAQCLIHYTPDTAFFANGSRFFNATANLYDVLATTKSFDIKHYERLVPRERICLVTQSYDGELHHVPCDFAEKRKEVVLIGLCEPDREECVAQLLKRDITVRIGGRGWERFTAQHKDNHLLQFEGAAVFGSNYVEALGRASVGLGLLTKRFGELHTTRTFEIPACGTALATERNDETSSFFDEEDVIFFSNHDELAERIAKLWEDEAALRSITHAGHRRVLEGPFNNDRVLNNILTHANIPCL